MTAADRRPVILYDTTLRDGTQGENITLSLADKLRIARMLDEYGMPYIEGGWPGSNPKDIEFFAAARTMRWRDREAGRLRLDPPPREPARTTTRTCASWSRPRRRSSRSSARRWLLHVTEVLGATPAENLDMIADSVGFVVERGREVVYDAEHFFDGYKADRDYALATLRAARQAGARHARPVRHERRHADRRADRRSSATSAAPLEADPDAPAVVVGHPHPQRRRAGGRQLDGRGRRPASATSRRTINGYGERCGNANMVSILANLALKTAARARARRRRPARRA